MGVRPSAAAAVSFATLIVVACSAAPAPTGSVTPADSIAPAATASPVATSASPSPTSTPAPTPFAVPSYPGPTPLPALPGVPFDLAWRSIDARDVPFGPDYLSGNGGRGWPQIVRWGEGAIVSYATYDDDDGPQGGPMIWRSTDLLSWHRVVWPEPDGHAVDVEQLLVGGPGLVALGSDRTSDTRVLWTSGDGEGWETITDLPPIELLWARPNLMIGYGQDTWLSHDGRDWTRAGPSPLSTQMEQGLARVGVVDDGETAVAFVLAFDRPTAVFRLWNDGHWEQLPNLDGSVSHAIRGPDGIVVIGSDGDSSAAWLSTDGVSWQKGAGPTGAVNLVLTSAGYVATSQRIYMDGCDGLPLAEQVAQTWTSHDGLTWRLMPEQLLTDHTVLSFVVPESGRVVAVGLRWSGSFAGDDRPQYEPVAFEASLPQPEPAHTPLPVAHGCGE